MVKSNHVRKDIMYNKTRLNRQHHSLLILLFFLLLFSTLGVEAVNTIQTNETGKINNVVVRNELQSLVGKMQGDSVGAVHIKYHPFTGRIRFMSTETGIAATTLERASPSASPEVVARSFLNVYGPVFGIKNQSEELTLIRNKLISEQGRSFSRFQQKYNGLPVMGGELIVQMKDKNVISINGETIPDIHLETKPTIGADKARGKALAAVLKWYNEDETGLKVTEPELWIYNPVLLGVEDNQDFLVWRMDVESTTLEPIKELVLVDAHTGGIVLHFNQVEGAKNRIIYDNVNNDSAGLPGTGPVRTEGGGVTGITDVDKAYDFAGDTYDFYLTNHGRDSIDNAGMSLISTVRYCYPTEYNQSCPLANAFWNGAQMVYGDGYASADDVVGHELTHGVTQYESNLYYYMQSGAINEHLSDMWGEFVDLSNSAGNDSPGVRWLMGEDIGAIRDMANPSSYGDPDKMTSGSYACGTADNGGVHSNSGVGNKLAYLLVDGDTFNGKTITGIGVNKAAKIYYEVQTNLLTSGSDYADLSDALYLACQSLIGTANITSSDCQQVKNATLAVEMGQQPTSCIAPVAPICETGTPVNLFFDDMENINSGNWVYEHFSGLWKLWWNMTTYAASGNYSLYGYDLAETGDGAITISNNVSLPSNETAYLHFKHAYGLEYSAGTAWDGGVLEYSTDGGSNWNDAGSLFTDNGYTGTLDSGNPLGVRQAFVDISNGYISSRLNLSSLSGSNVRFRFRIANDAAVGDKGWWVDDVRIYTCDTPPTITFVSPTPANSTILNQNWVYVNVTADETLSTALLEWNGVNETMDSGSWHLNKTRLVDGTYTYRVWANDTGGNWNSTELRMITVDTTSPSTSDDSPAGWQTTAFTVNLTCVDATSGCAVTSYQLDDGAWTIGTTVAITADLNHTIRYNSTDVAGNVEITKKTYAALDTTPPTIAITSPQNTTYNTPSVPLIYSVNEPTSWAGYSLDGATNVTLDGNTTLTDWIEGPHSIFIWGNDTVGNLNSTTVYFTINFTLGTYSNSSVTTSANQTLNVNATEVNVTLDIYTSQDVNGSVNMTLTSVNQSGTNALGVPALGRYLQINASPAIEGNLTWAKMSIYYSDEEVTSAGLVEEYLSMYWWNESSSEWVELNDTMNWVFGTGVNTTANYVWANVSHFSYYALGVPQLPAWVNLSDGWNMFGVPVGISNYSLPTALSSIAGSYDWVFYFNATTDAWQYYNPGMPQFSDLKELEAGRGYFIQMTANATLNFTGTMLTSLTIPLQTDWNMFAPPTGMTNYSLPTALNSIAGSYDWVFYYNATTDTWQYFNPSMPQFSDLTKLEAGRGYFIQMITNDTWSW